jgi:hypothetical protein
MMPFLDGPVMDGLKDGVLWRFLEGELVAVGFTPAFMCLKTFNL